MSAVHPAAARPSMSPAAAALPGMRWERAALVVAVVVGGLFIPRLVGSAFQLDLLLRGLMLGIAAVGIGFLMHQCGLVMFGVAAFIGLPAYLVGIGSLSLGLGLGAAVLFALAGSTLFALAVGALVVRARPLPFAMLTLALAQMLRSVTTLRSMRPITGGDDGLVMTFNGDFLGLSPAALGKPETLWPVAWIALCGVLALLWWAGRSRFGQKLRAIKSNEERMRFSGFDTYLPRLAAFVLSCFVVSISGVLIALSSAFASPELVDFATGGNALVAMLVGGGATVGGPLLGAMLYTWGQDLFGATGHLELLTGIATVAVLVFFPTGAMGFVLGIVPWLRARLGGWGGR